MAHPTDDKNFRLPTTLRPRRYQATVTLDLEGRSFTGEERVELELSQPTTEIILHANALELGEVTFRAGNDVRKPSSKRVSTVSETVVLTFDAPLPAGSATLDVPWTG